MLKHLANICTCDSPAKQPCVCVRERLCKGLLKYNAHTVWPLSRQARLSPQDLSKTLKVEEKLHKNEVKVSSLFRPTGSVPGLTCVCFSV